MNKVRANKKISKDPASRLVDRRFPKVKDWNRFENDSRTDSRISN